ncbi:MAG: Hsp70 family protein [Blastocatellia bacterium]|nr:Hsp70 family protein [Blastocatellia bacterium]
MQPHEPAVGIDFGTSNSALAIARPDGQVQTLSFRMNGRLQETIRSILYFEPPPPGKRMSAVHVGETGIQEYLDSEGNGRLMQSLKSFLTSQSFTTTNVFGRNHTLEDLITYIIRHLAQTARETLGEIGTKITVGRPIRFFGAETPEAEQLALDRLRTAVERAGFTDIQFEYEPIGAAFTYQQRLTSNETVLIGDFGGGTSDFSLLHLEPSQAGNRPRAKILGNAGVPIGGNTFDSRIIHHLISPKLGLGSTFVSMGKSLPMPSWIYANLEQWHLLSFLRSAEVVRTINQVRVQASEPNQLDNLRDLIQHNLGYRMFQAVEKSKIDLSRLTETRFSFDELRQPIESRLTQAEFESWIKMDLEHIEETVDRLLVETGISQQDVHSVFLTGGSCLIPAIRKVFINRFGADRIRSGQELTSVACGLALRGLALVSNQST